MLPLAAMVLCTVEELLDRLKDGRDERDELPKPVAAILLGTTEEAEFERCTRCLTLPARSKVKRLLIGGVEASFAGSDTLSPRVMVLSRCRPDPAADSSLQFR